MFLCVYISLFTSCLCAASCIINDDDDDDDDDSWPGSSAYDSDKSGGVAGAMVSGTADGLLPDLPEAQFSLLSKPGDFGDFVLDLLAGDVILPSESAQRLLQATLMTSCYLWF